MTRRSGRCAPILGPGILDEAQSIRIRLKFVAMDVATRRWTSFTNRRGKSVAVSNALGRDRSDARQVEERKRVECPIAVREFVRRYGG